MELTHTSTKIHALVRQGKLNLDENYSFFIKTFFMFRRNCLDSIDSKRRKNCNRFFSPNIIRQQKKIQYRIFFLYCKYFCRQYFFVRNSARHSRFDYINHLTEKINNLTETSFGSMKFFRIFYFELKHWSMWPVDFFRLNFILQLCCNNNNEVQVRTAHGCKLLY